MSAEHQPHFPSFWFQHPVYCGYPCQSSDNLLSLFEDPSVLRSLHSLFLNRYVDLKEDDHCRMGCILLRLLRVAVLIETVHELFRHFLEELRSFTQGLSKNVGSFSFNRRTNSYVNSKARADLADAQ